MEEQERFLMEEKDSREGNPKRANLEIGDPGGWHSRGYLPHFEGAEVPQHVTFHLADSLPKAVLERMEARVEDSASGEAGSGTAQASGGMD